MAQGTTGTGTVMGIAGGDIVERDVGRRRWRMDESADVLAIYLSFFSCLGVRDTRLDGRALAGNGNDDLSDHTSFHLLASPHMCHVAVTAPILASVSPSEVGATGTKASAGRSRMLLLYSIA